MKKVALVVGHRSKAQGAWGSAGLSEWEYNRQMAKYVNRLIMDHPIPGVEVKIFYRDDLPGGYGEKMKRLHKRIDEWGADYSISMHFNAAGKEEVNGHEVLYCSKRGKRVAKMMDEILAKFLENKERGIKRVRRKDRGGGFLCQGRSVCILVEPFFAAHQHKYIISQEGWNHLANAYYELINWLGNTDV